MTTLVTQAIYKAGQLFSKEHPAAMAMAMKAVNQWGKQEMTLQHAIGEAIREAHEAGSRGEPLTEDAPARPSGPMRRSRPLPEPTPPPTTTRMRRSR